MATAAPGMSPAFIISRTTASTRGESMAPSDTVSDTKRIPLGLLSPLEKEIGEQCRVGAGHGGDALDDAREAAFRGLVRLALCRVEIIHRLGDDVEGAIEVSAASGR